MNRKQAALFVAHDLLTSLRGEATNLIDGTNEHAHLEDVIVGTMPRMRDLLERIESAAREAQK